MYGLLAALALLAPGYALAADSETIFLVGLLQPFALLGIALIAVPIHWIVRNKLPDGHLKRLLTKKL